MSFAYNVTEYMGLVNQLPYCALCGGPVRSLCVDFLDRSSGEPWLIIFVAYCHGDSDSTVLEIEDLLALIDEGAMVSGGWAFGSPLSEVEAQWATDTNEGDSIYVG